MTFTVTYRDRTGAKREEAIEAADRAACAAACRARGISPIAIREGKGLNGLKGAKADKGDNSLKGVNGDGRAASPRRPQSIPHSHNSIFSHFHNSTFLAVLGILALLAILGGIWWFGVRGAPALPGDGNGLRGASALPDDNRGVKTLPGNGGQTGRVPMSSDGRAGAPRTPQHPPQLSPYPTNEHSIVLDRPVVRFEAQTNDAGRVVEHIWTDDGKLHTNIYSTKPPVFESGTDELLALAVQARPGEMPPPPPPVDPMDEKLFLESLKKPIVISDSDSPEVRALKEKVIQARKDMAAMIAEGRSFAEVLAENQKLQEENAIARQGVVANLKKILAEGDMETARRFVEESNKVLEQMGIMPVAIPAAAGGESAPKGDLMRMRKEENKQ